MSGSFHFLRAEWLLALPAVALLVYLSIRMHALTSPWQRVCDPKLLPHILAPGSAPRRGLHWAFALAAALAIVALAGPAWRQLPSPTFSSQAGLILLLDASRSMHATDLTPSRIARARHKILDILAKRADGATGLIVYAADPFTVTPLTRDTSTIAALVPSLSADIMPSQGSRPDKALEAARALFEQAGYASGHVVVLTDDADDPRFEQTARALWADGFRVSLLGVGTTDGAPIPTPEGGFVSDVSGAIVIPKLDQAALLAAARAGGGRFSMLTADDRDIENLLAGGTSQRDFAQNEQSEVQNQRWREEGPWLLLLVLPIVALAFRRGAIVCIAVVVAPTLLHSPPAAALSWEALWRTPDQRAARVLDDEPQRAAELFEARDWQAAAHYRSGNYQAAVDTLTQLDDADAHYNRGNALARLGQIEDAIAAYEQTLALDREHADARYNKDLLEELLEQQQQEQQSESSAGEPDPQASTRDQNQQTEADETQASAAASDSEPAQDETNEPAEDGPGDQPQARRDEQEARDDPSSPSAEATPEETADDETAEQQAALSELSEQHGDPATEHWLRRIPDDPGGLLRRKFLYQYRERGDQSEESQQW